MPQQSVSESVTRTASDALMAKASAMASGYQPLPQNAEVYQDFLASMSDRQTKPQSPLVSAGYAMRLASVSQAIHSFVSFHETESVNIVLLGCGMDVLGLWASSLAEGVQIWEVDTLPVATAKRDKLLNADLVVSDGNDHSPSVKEGGLVLEGRIRHKAEPNTEDYPSSNYYRLLSCDLQDLQSLDQTLGQAFVASEHHGCPTLVVFELVLAYLKADATNNLLEWCASNLLRPSNQSALVAFEALGSSTPATKPNSTPSNIVQAYHQEYTRQFEAKLQRGRANGNNREGILFQPLGSSCEQVEERLQGLGCFQKVHASLAGTVAHWAEKKQSNVHLTLPTGELFDEHAALTLHLSSYAQVVAFTSNDSQEDLKFRQELCPWHSNYSWTRPIGDNNTYVTPVEVEDEAVLRDVFVATYKNLSQTYPAVQKMVKATLKKELASNQATFTKSTVRLSYQRLGGEFFAAVQYPTEGGRRVLGGIGIKKWQKMATTTTDDPNLKMGVPIYEIHRFFVDKESRRGGIGTSLLHMAESWVQSKAKRSTHICTYRIVATTLAVLEEANHFYTKNGYSLDDEASIGELQMKTYAKDCGVQTAV